MSRTKTYICQRGVIVEALPKSGQYYALADDGSAYRFRRAVIVDDGIEPACGDKCAIVVLKTGKREFVIRCLLER